MSLSLSVLGSGSLGNSSVLRIDGSGRRRHLLIDAGLSPRRTAASLEPLGVQLAAVDGVLLTHLDADHFNQGWRRWLRREPVTVHVHHRHRHLAVRRGVPVRQLSVFGDDVFEPANGVSVHGLLLAHDQLGTVGYRIECGDRRLGFATDLGRVPKSLLRHFEGVSVLALESNYDRRMQLDSERPEFLTRRIMGGAGHLSNDQALDAVLRIDDAARLSGVVLLHVSRECNDPRLIRRLFAGRAPHLSSRLTISRQDRPTPLLEVASPSRRGEQLLFSEAFGIGDQPSAISGGVISDAC